MTSFQKTLPKLFFGFKTNFYLKPKTGNTNNGTQPHMKTLSIQQPWAWAILNAGKDIENRQWSTSFLGRILIHAGKRVDTEGITYLQSRGLTPPIFYSEFDKTLGGILGSIEITDCVRESKNDWFFGKFGFVLKDPIVLPFKPCKGQLGFFEVDYFNL